MAQSILSVLIKLAKTGDGDKQTVKGLLAVKYAIGTATAVMGALVGAAYAVDKALDASVGKFNATAAAVAEISGTMNSPLKSVTFVPSSMDFV